MITNFKIFENSEGWTTDKIKKQLGIENVLNPTDIFFDEKSRTLYDGIVKYFIWKYNIEICHISYFFTNAGAQLGVKFVDEDAKTYLPIINEDEPDLVKFLNDPDLFMGINNYNL